MNHVQKGNTEKYRYQRIEIKLDITYHSIAKRHPIKSMTYLRNSIHNKDQLVGLGVSMSDY